MGLHNILFVNLYCTIGLCNSDIIKASNMKVSILTKKIYSWENIYLEEVPDIFLWWSQTVVFLQQKFFYNNNFFLTNYIFFFKLCRPIFNCDISWDDPFCFHILQGRSQLHCVTGIYFPSAGSFFQLHGSITRCIPKSTSQFDCKNSAFWLCKFLSKEML